ncbi:hypothetical protein GLYMA_08G182100v4 [Glycine max]|nr:hypothetical protein GLYMA_08G182100v4 [Glycine max]
MVMEVHDHTSYLIYFISSIIVFALFKLVQRSDSKTSSTCCKLPPGPRTLPLIGNMHQFVGSLPVHHCLKNLADNYGPLMHLKLGEVSNIIVTSQEMAQEIMKTRDLNFSDRPNLVSSRIVSYNGSNIVFSQHGEYWRQLRKICTVELLTAKRVQSFRSIREEEVAELVKKIAATASEAEGSNIFNLTENIYSVTFGIAARAAFGKKSRYQQVFISNIDKQLKLMGGFSVADLYPSSRVLQMMGASGKLEKVHKVTDRVLQDIIDEHKNRTRSSSNEECEAVEDLVDVLLKFQKESSEFPLTDENIKAVIQVSSNRSIKKNQIISIN